MKKSKKNSSKISQCSHGISIGDTTNFVKTYNIASRLYDYFCKSEDKNEEIINYIRRFCNIAETVALDIGCGTGKYTNILARYCKEVIGVDPSNEQLQFARKTAKKLKIINVKYIKGVGENIPLPRNFVNLIIITWVTMCSQCSFKEMERVLKTEGFIVRVSPYRKDHLTSLFPNLNISKMKRNNKWFKDRGFKTVYRKIIISFSTIKESKNILSKVIGAKRNKINRRVFNHYVVVQTHGSKKH